MWQTELQFPQDASCWIQILPQNNLEVFPNYHVQLDVDFVDEQIGDDDGGFIPDPEGKYK